MTYEHACKLQCNLSHQHMQIDILPTLHDSDDYFLIGIESQSSILEPIYTRITYYFESGKYMWVNDD